MGSNSADLIFRQSQISSAINGAIEIWDSSAVHGAEDGDPVGIEALMRACMEAQTQKTQNIWFDCLCMMQTSKDDKAFQIKNIYSIYWSCTACIVMPGGMRRLEVIAPKMSLVVFSWGRGSGQVKRSKTNVYELMSKTSAYAGLAQLLQLHTSDSVFTNSNGGEQQLDLTRGSLHHRASPHGVQLRLPVRQRHRTKQCPNMALDILGRIAEHAQGPVDMVFSIMGMFGVKQRDLMGMTTSALRSRSRRKFSITAAPRAGSPHNFIFPLAPSSPAFRYFRQLMSRWPPGWWLDNAPKGIMDHARYLNFVAKAAPAVYLRKQRSQFPETANMDTVDDQGSTVIAALDGNPKLYNLPWIVRRVWAEGMAWGTITMLVQEHAPGG
ncbi:hypothetical protein BKA93DRAFT_826917 [Sparassis latifolia]